MKILIVLVVMAVLTVAGFTLAGYSDTVCVKSHTQMFVGRFGVARVCDEWAPRTPTNR